MSRGLPSMTALLGLLAIAGYQNRDKIAEMLGGLTGGGSDPSRAPASPDDARLPNRGGSAGSGSGAPGGLGGLLGGLGGAGLGGLLGGGLNDLVDSFRRNGEGEVADSWVGTGANKEVAPAQVEKAVGPDIIDTLARQTGLTREELLARLSQVLPQAVDKYTPDGRIPGPDEWQRT